MKLLCVDSWDKRDVYEGFFKPQTMAPALVQMLLVACSLSFTRQSNNLLQLLSNVSD